VAAGGGGGLGDTGHVIQLYNAFNFANSSVTSGSAPLNANIGPQSYDPWTAGNAPRVPDVVGGADAFGLTNLTTGSVSGVVGAAPAGSSVAILRVPIGPGPYQTQFSGFDYLFEINLTGTSAHSGTVALGSPFMVVNGNGQNLTLGGWVHDPNFGGSGNVPLSALGNNQIYLALVNNNIDPTVLGGYTNPAGLPRYFSTAALGASSALYGPPPAPSAVLQSTASPVAHYSGEFSVPHDGSVAGVTVSNTDFANAVFDDLLPDATPINVFLQVDQLGSTTVDDLIAALLSDGVNAFANNPALSGVSGYNLEMTFPSSGIPASQNFWYDFSDYGDLSVTSLAAQQFAQAVPEPSAILLAALGVLIFARAGYRSGALACRV
jgi:hypothetical protein